MGGIFRFKGPKGAEKTARRDLRRAAFLYGKFTLQQCDTSIFTCFHGVSIPQAHLNLANMAGADQQHAQPGLANAAADGLGQLTVQQRSCGRAAPALVAVRKAVSWRSRAAASTRMPMEDSSKLRSRMGFHMRISPFSSQSS